MTKEGLPLNDISTYNEELDRFMDNTEKNAHDKANAAARQPGDFPGSTSASDFLKYYDKDPNDY